MPLVSRVHCNNFIARILAFHRRGPITCSSALLRRAQPFVTSRYAHRMICDLVSPRRASRCFLVRSSYALRNFKTPHWSQPFRRVRYGSHIHHFILRTSSFSRDAATIPSLVRPPYNLRATRNRMPACKRWMLAPTSWVLVDPTVFMPA